MKILGALSNISYSEYWEYWSTGVINTASSGSMSSTEGPHIASTRIMWAVQNPDHRHYTVYPSWVSNPEILGVQAVCAVQNAALLRVLSVYNPKVLPVLRLPPPKVICSNCHSWDHLRTFSANQWAWNHRHGAQMVEVYLILRVYWAYI